MNMKNTDSLVSGCTFAGLLLLMSHGLGVLAVYFFGTFEEDATLGDAGLYWFGAPLLACVLASFIAAGLAAGKVANGIRPGSGLLFGFLACLPVVGLAVFAALRMKLVAALRSEGLVAGWQTAFVAESGRSCSVCGSLRVRSGDVSNVCRECLRSIV